MLARCSRLAVLVVLVGACGYERTPITKRVATLGYSKPPAIAVVARGDQDLVEPWVASLRAASTSEVITFIKEADPSGSTQQQLCKDVQAATPPDAHLDEIVTIDATVTNRDITSCVEEKCKADLLASPDQASGCTCVRSRYGGTRAVVSTKITAYRASTCETLRSEVLPELVGTSTRKPFEYGDPGVIEEGGIQIGDAILADTDESRAAVAAAVAQAARYRTWRTFPREVPIVSVKNHTVVVGGQLPDGDYWLKLGPHNGLKPGVRAVDRSPTTTTFQLSPELPTPVAGDELHVVTDMRRVSGYAAFGGGTVRAHDESYKLANAAVAARFAYDRLPVMSEISLSGELVPWLDAQSASISGAAGFRAPFEPLSPVVFAELGVGTAHQGSDGARAVTGHVGLGAGVELWLETWFVFGDIRRRWFALSDWVDKDGNPVRVDHPDSSWRSTTVQLGIGRRL